MLEYYKIILTKVSFNESLFTRELKKALRALLPNEIKEFKRWCIISFSNYQPILNQIFSRHKA